MRAPDVRAVTRLALVAVPTLVVATAVVELLQDGLGIPNASVVYLVAVVVAALVAGTPGAIVAALASFVLSDYLFTEPRFTLAVAQPAAWLSLLVLLFVGAVVGELVALQRSRAELAETREREARAQFRLSRALATRSSTPAVLPDVVRILATETAMGRIWVALGPDNAAERVAADSAGGDARPPRPPSPALGWILRRLPGDVPAEWVRVHRPGVAGRPAGDVEDDSYRVRIEAEARVLGSIWARRPRRVPPPDRTETRLLSAAADLVGLALAQDRLAAASQAAEIAQASDVLKSALLQSVSHDLRTPLATIQAAAGSLRPDSELDPASRAETSAAIEREVEYLNRLVTNLLDLSRIEAGALRAERDAYALDDLLGPAIERARARLGDRTISEDLDAPAVLVDPVLLDAIVGNLLDNATKHTPEGTAIRILARGNGDRRVRLTIEDSGRGVPPASLGRLFDKFYRSPEREPGSRGGTGIGLAVVRGLAEAMGATASARASELGGLAVDVDLTLASLPPTATSDAAEMAPGAAGAEMAPGAAGPR